MLVSTFPSGWWKSTCFLYDSKNVWINVPFLRNRWFNLDSPETFHGWGLQKQFVGIVGIFLSAQYNLDFAKPCIECKVSHDEHLVTHVCYRCCCCCCCTRINISHKTVVYHVIRWINFLWLRWTYVNCIKHVFSVMTVGRSKTLIFLFQGQDGLPGSPGDTGMRGSSGAPGERGLTGLAGAPGNRVCSTFSLSSSSLRCIKRPDYWKWN